MEVGKIPRKRFSFKHAILSLILVVGLIGFYYLYHQISPNNKLNYQNIDSNQNHVLLQNQWTSPPTGNVIFKSTLTDLEYYDTAPEENSLEDSVTVVTAYFNIGSFQKGEGADKFTPDMYRKWMRIFGRIENPVIAYLDNDNDISVIKAMRSHLASNLTKLIKVSRERLWAFKICPKIAEIFAQKDYPKHHPNTVVSEYTCAMHAKYELVLKSVEENPFKTKYFCWLDIGLFREVTSHGPPIQLYLPPGFDDHKVAYTEVDRRATYLEPRDIFFNNLHWVCGCFFIARSSVMAKWTTEYMRAVEGYISERIMNTDQQVIFAMFNEGKHTVDIQTYVGDGRYNSWFHLGFMCWDEGAKRQLKQMASKEQ